jgi:hypothetical protein
MFWLDYFGDHLRYPTSGMCALIVNRGVDIIFNGLWGIHLCGSKRKKSRILLV